MNTYIHHILSECVADFSPKRLKKTREFSRLKRARDQLQSKSDECSRVKEENSELDEEIKQVKENHQ